MEPDESYNLYHRRREFIGKAQKRGFCFTELGDDGSNYCITKKIIPTKVYPVSVARVGEIINRRFLIIFTSQCDGENKRFDNAVSKLQKLARDFEL